jgi:WD40 repeat protein
VAADGGFVALYHVPPQAPPEYRGLNWSSQEGLSPLPEDVRGLVFTPDGRHLVAGSSEVGLRVWRLTGRLATEEAAEVPDLRVHHLALDPGGRWLAVLEDDGEWVSLVDLDALLR